MAQPARERPGIDRAVAEGPALAPGRRAVGVVGDAANALEQRQIAVLLVEMGEDVGERGEDRHAGAPAVAVAGAEQQRLLHQLSRPGRRGRAAPAPPCR